MSKRLVITVSDDVYDYFQTSIGRRRIHQVINDLVETHLSQRDFEAGYRAMAADVEYEREAREWIEGVTSHFAGDRTPD